MFSSKFINLFSLLFLFTTSYCKYTSATELDKNTHQFITTSEPSKENVNNELFLSLILEIDEQNITKTINNIENTWHPKFTSKLIEMMTYIPSPDVRSKLLTLLQKQTGKNYSYDPSEWYKWLWNQPETIAEDYAQFKAELYRVIDPRFGIYFKNRQNFARIRLDEIRWGGVVQDGIPPLRSPKMIDALQANYLAQNDVVFGMVINGDARAYPKRILAWHEMFTDTIGGVDIAGVYCTLCGTVIPYKTNHKGINYKLGTSGFLYRSNKLMYDEKTQSLWNTIKGEPVLGTLVDKDITLEYLSVVTTTWGEWQRRHPKTTVLSLNTGYQRDYDEGVAYSDYFATDRLMFNTPFNDPRLKNKQEILALRFTGAPNKQLAIDTRFLIGHPLYTDQVGIQKVIVLTDKTGANRVYDPEEVLLTEYDQNKSLIDSKGNNWQLSENALIASNGRKLKRLPAHRAFWFGWHANFPKTRLVK